MRLDPTVRTHLWSRLAAIVEHHWDTVDTEQSCWTPTKGYYDGAHWWRVAMIDGQGKIGAYSDPAVFHKAYPQPPLTGPEPGAVTPAT